MSGKKPIIGMAVFASVETRGVQAIERDSIRFHVI